MQADNPDEPSHDLLDALLAQAGGGADEDDQPDDSEHIAKFEPFVRKVIEIWTAKEAIEVDPDQVELFVEELKYKAGDAASPYKMLKALAKHVEVSECVEEYYASREELIDMIRPLVDM